MEQYCLIRRPLKLGVVLCLGQVQRTETGVLGSGAEQAAHVLSKARAGSIIINTALFENLKEQWGAPKAGKYFTLLRQHEMKEISLHPIQELFSFDWQEFKNNYPEHSLAKLVFQHLRQGKVEAPYLSIKDLSKSGVIIWPVVPRDVVNAIHRGQAEIIRLLVILGWKVHLLIADCGAPNNYDES